MTEDDVHDVDDGDESVTTVKTQENKGSPGEDYSVTTKCGQVECDRVEVTGADYASCNGEYEVMDWRNPLAPHRPTYKHISKQRFIYWDTYPSYGWTIAPKRAPTGAFHFSYGQAGLSPHCEPWQESWKRGI